MISVKGLDCEGHESSGRYFRIRKEMTASSFGVSILLFHQFAEGELIFQSICRKYYTGTRSEFPFNRSLVIIPQISLSINT